MKKLIAWMLIISLVVMWCKFESYAATENYSDIDKLDSNKEIGLKGNFVVAPSPTPTVQPTKTPTKSPSKTPTKKPNQAPTATKKPSVIYNIDITWESTKFTYTMGDETWNAEKHSMEIPQGGKSGSWSKGKNNAISLINNSSVKLTAKLGFEALNSSGVNGIFNRNSVGTGSKISTISVGAKGGANAGSGYLILSGVPSHKWLANTSNPIGKVTVAINN